MIPNVKVLQKSFFGRHFGRLRRGPTSTRIEENRAAQPKDIFFEPTLDEVYEQMHRNPKLVH